MKRWLTFHDAAVEVHRKNPGISKEAFAATLRRQFSMERLGAAFYAHDFSVSFSESTIPGFPGTVVGLRKIQKFDAQPFLVSLLRPGRVETFLANSSFIRKVSLASQKLTLTRIRGSINGTDILRELDGLKNVPANFESLFEVHASFTWQDNLERIVEATSGIVPTGRRFDPTAPERERIIEASSRSREAEESGRLAEIEATLNLLLEKNQVEVLLASQSGSPKRRGDSVERLLTGEKNFHRLDDCLFEVKGKIRVCVDFKTKRLDLSSKPKLYNIDKTLRHFADGNSISCIFLIGIDPEGKRVVGRLIDVLDSKFIANTKTGSLWAGRNSRGVTQFCGDLHPFLEPTFRRQVDSAAAEAFLKKLLSAGQPILNSSGSADSL